MISGSFHHGILVSFVAIGLDKVDGSVARATGTSSPFGRQVDSFLDVFTYLVPAALVVHCGISPHPVVSAVVGFLIIGFGCLRLVRHNDEGIRTEGGVSYYRGTTVVHTALLVVAGYLAVATLPLLNGWVVASIIAATCPLMVSDYRCAKTPGAHWVGALLVVILAGLVLIVATTP